MQLVKVAQGQLIESLARTHLAVVLLQDHDYRVTKLVGLGDVVNPEDPREAVAASLRVAERRQVILVAPKTELLPPAEVPIRLKHLDCARQDGKEFGQSFVRT